MSIEIKQLMIKTSVNDQGSSAYQDTGGGASDVNSVDKAEILKECREMVLDIIRNQSER